MPASIRSTLLCLLTMAALTEAMLGNHSLPMLVAFELTHFRDIERLRIAQ